MENSGGLAKKSGSLKKSRGNTGRLISSHYLEVEGLMDAVERATNHYQTLGIERTASNEEIVGAYHKAVRVLHPSYYKVRRAQTDQMLPRIDESFNKISQAFFVLTDSRNRAEYDQTLNLRQPAPIPAGITKAQAKPAKPPQEKPPAQFAGKAESDDKADSKKAASGESRSNGGKQAAAQSASEVINLRETATHQAVFTNASTDSNSTKRRRCDRFKISIPVLVAGADRESGKWQEMSKSFDLSRMGVGIRLSHHVWPGMILHLTMPMPVRLRAHGYADPSYKVYAIVRRAEPIKDGARVVGLEFLGEHPPSLYLYRPWASFRTQEWGGPDRRQEPRSSITEIVRVEYLNEAMEVIEHDTAYTENVSAGGARLYVKNAPADFEMVRIANQKRTFKSLAVVRNRYMGRDGMERLCLQFTEGKWSVKL